MAKAFQLIVTGNKEVDAALAGLERKVQAKAVRTAARNVAKTIAKDAKAKTPRDEGQAVRSIKVRAIKRSRVRIGSMVIAGSDDRGDSPWHFKFLELGKQGFKGLSLLRGPLYDKETQHRREFEKQILTTLNQTKAK